MSIEEFAYIGLGWALLILAIICLGATFRRLKIALYGPEPKDET